MAALKSQDVALVLSLCRSGSEPPPLSRIAADLCISASEVHAAIKRAQASRLLHTGALGRRPNLNALEEFLIHGLKYAFPPQRGEPARGVPTSYAAPPLRDVIAPGDEPPPVWPHPDGTQRGTSFEPLYPKAPQAALRDPALYELLALADALRDGRARERKLAEEMIVTRLRAALNG